LKTSSTTLSEFENDIRLKLKLQENIEMVMHYKENEKLYVLDDMEDLEEGMTIQVSASNAPTGATQLQQTSKKIEGIFNGFLFFFFFLRNFSFEPQNFY